MTEYMSILDFPRGTLYRQLADAYSFCPECKEHWDNAWKEYDDFFYSNPDIAQKYGFVTVYDGVPVGHITWDPRHRPEYVIIGHNCIVTAYKGKGLGKAQLSEAVRRIKEYRCKKIIVTTNEITFSAQKNYERVGFLKIAERENRDTPFAGKYIDYELTL